MRIKMNTIMAHPKHGVAQPGEIIDLPEADAAPLLKGGHANPVTQKTSPAAVPVRNFQQSKSGRVAPAKSEADRAAQLDERNRKASGYVAQFISGELGEDSLIEKLTELGIDVKEISDNVPKLKEEKAKLAAQRAGAGETAAVEGAPENAMQPNAEARK